jgi:xanthine/uracil/vitamin C permease (AzgA family)
MLCYGECLYVVLRSGISSNLPFTIGPSLGLTSYLSWGLLRSGSLTWSQALAAAAVAGSTGNIDLYLLLDHIMNMNVYMSMFPMWVCVGICAFILSLFRATDFLFRVIPPCIRVATVVGTGLMLAMIGLQHGGIIVPDSVNGLTFGDIANRTLWYTYMYHLIPLI